MQDGSFLYFLGILIVFCAILFLAWLTTRLIGKRFQGEQKAKRMRVVETLPLGVDRSLLLVRVGEKHYLLASGRGHMDFMSEVDPGPAPQEPDAAVANDFRTLLERYSGLGRASGANQGPEETMEERPVQTGVRRLRKINGNGKGEDHPL